MSKRVALPIQAAIVAPGYTWRLDLDLMFDGDRPDDWPLWTIRMHVWSRRGPLFTLAPGDGVTFEEVEFLPGADEALVIPVIRMTGQQTALLTTSCAAQYLIDVTPPGGDVEGYFSGSFTIVPGPPLEMIQ
ncbi:hypothetical protein F9K91_07655 [Brucella tritici]|uniref:Uncharacterized protein n=1 Tax=Brucella tritici TaxID=94626 RepID=A0A833CNK9_9HYPH|nr:hypothetical protein [Brucella tritici]KAB2665996.1 hypothetical protein F9K91_07655 [Brucella tritici]